jgi:hypothetical protein
MPHRQDFSLNKMSCRQNIFAETDALQAKLMKQNVSQARFFGLNPDA